MTSEQYPNWRRGTYTRSIEPRTLVGEEEWEDLAEVQPYIILPPVQRGIDTAEAPESEGRD